ncbi:NAD-dependent epimerase/dehydratase family protein [Xanthovirga aplysinae]|uniref:NAD-dependent epimerase/dehydratase family protein n=1 Tax=Xanthovirga aplysinae TaxID=2529853 RepID=UPI0012BC5748|nr:NAD-dependent epimerase/dehydratase family protein [Xanthovirga aplysinae]MTI32877.1 NAD-dependent epimerase/dehydratase family protein [Xanthovirga aplysinae]
MKVLVTGANGLLASNIIEELLERGMEVRGMVRKTSNLLSLEGLRYEKFIGNISEPKDVAEAVKGCDVVIHVAADTNPTATLENLWSTNVESTQFIINEVRNHQVKRLIFVSTSNTFEYGTKEQPGKEKGGVSPVFQKSGYALSKLEAQNLVLEAASEGKINAVVVNPTFMIGARDAKPSSGEIILLYHRKRLAFVPPGGKNFVSVKDVAKGTCNAIDKGRSGECYLLGNENLSYEDFVEKLSRVSGQKTKTLKLPAFILKFAGAGGSLINKLGGNSRLTYTSAQFLTIKNYYTSQKAVKELDFPQTPLKEAIKEALQWFKGIGYL